MVFNYNFDPRINNQIPDLVDLVKARVADESLSCEQVVWDTEMKFYDYIWEDVLSGKEKATFRAVKTNPLQLRLPAARVLPVIITKEDDPKYRQQWGTIELTQVWFGKLETFPKTAARYNNAKSYREFLGGALCGYCELGGMQHLASMYFLGAKNIGKTVEVSKPRDVF